jgi:hypothetical protein
MSDAALKAKTGATWPEWVRVLDGAGAAQMPHRDIAAWLSDQDVADWWSQTITVGYERIRGLRDVGQRRDGLYEASKSRTFAVPIERLYDAFALKRARDRWLPGDVARLRNSNRPKVVRFDFPDGTAAAAYFTAKGKVTCQVAVQHGKLPDRAAVVDRKEFWQERLTLLGEVLSGG